MIGEAREWETVEYVDDAVAAGEDKALVIVGHIPSEQAGMEECARWLKGFVTEVPWLNSWRLPTRSGSRGRR